MKRILGLIVLAIVIIVCSVEFAKFTIRHHDKHNLPISMPEEISLAKPGDKLVVLKITDSIYLGYANQLELKTLMLIDEGYSKVAAEHIAKVELGIIPPDNEYNDLMED